MSVFSDQLILWAINVLIHATVLTALLLLIAMLFRRRAVMRYWIFCCGLLLVLGSPAISALIQSRGNSWFVLAAPADAARAETVSTAYPDKLIPPKDAPSAASSPIMDLGSASLNETVPLMEFSDRASVGDSVNLPVAASGLATEPVAKSRLLMQWLGRGVVFAVLIWAVGAAAILLRMLVGWMRLSRILKRADPIEDAGFQAAFSRACAAVGCDGRRTPRLVASNEISGPMAAGIFGGSVVLPKRLIAQADPGELADVLIHEVAHVVRRDQVIVLLQNLVSAIYWPHPLVRKLNRELAKAREEVCDNFVLANTDAPVYSRTLLSLAQLVQHPETMPGSVGFFASRWKLEQRVAGLLDETRDRTTFLSRRGLLFIGSTGLLLATAACLGTITLATESLAENVTDEDRLLEGAVFDPNGKPISAQVWIAGPPRSAGWKPSPMPVKWSRVTTSDQFGRFQVPKSILDQFPKNETLRPLMARVAATSPGHGFAWADIEIDQPSSDVTLRLVQDVTVQGKLVSTEGNPIRGVEVSVVDVTQPDPLPDSKKLIESGSSGSGVYTNWPMWMGGPPHSQTVMTDAEGTFALSGIGAERYLRLQARGDSIADTRLLIATRRPPADLESGMIGTRTGRAESKYFSEFTHITVPGRTITGKVTDVSSQSPIAGVRVVAPTAWGSRMEPTFTDESGRFKIGGIPKDQQYTLELTPEGRPGYFRKEVVITDSPSENDLLANMTLTKGNVLTGRIVDAETGQGLAATIQYNALYPNPHVDEMGNEEVANPLAVTRTSNDGAFAIAVLPGLGAVGVRTEDKSYAKVFLDSSEVEQHFQGLVMEAKPDPTGRYNHFPTANGGQSRGIMGIRQLNAFKLLNVDPSRAMERIQLAINRAAVRNGEIFDAAGEPLTGVEVIGLGPSQVSNTDAPLRTNKFSVLGLHPAGSRTLLFYDRQRSLGASVVVNGSEQSLIRVTMRPTGSIVGKFVDSLGKPARKLEIEELGLSDLGITGTGFWIPEYRKDGTFKCEGLIEGVAYDLRARTPAKPYSLPVLSEFQATPGQVTDIGTFKVTDDGGFEVIAIGSIASSAPENGDTKRILEDELSTVASRVQSQLSFSGRVTDRAGKPLSGVELRLVGARPGNPGHLSKVLATSDADGAFEFGYEMPSKENAKLRDALKYSRLVASKNGFGVAVAYAALAENTGQLASLLNDEERRYMIDEQGGDTPLVMVMPTANQSVRGRILNTDGLAVVGAEVSTITVYEGKTGSLDEWNAETKRSGANYYSARDKLNTIISGSFVDGPMPTAIPTVLTDSEGYFELPALGDHRIAELLVSHDSIETSLLYVRSEDVQKIELPEDSNGRRTRVQTYYPNRFTFVAGATRPVVGRLVDYESGEPVAGVRVEGYRTPVHTAGGSMPPRAVRDVSADDGSFRLEGFPIGRNELRILPPAGSPYMIGSVSVTTKTGDNEVRTDIKMRQGILQRGRIVESGTNNAVAGYFEYWPLEQNPAVAETPMLRNGDQRVRYMADEKGFFEIPVLHGRGILTFMANDDQRYQRGAGAETIPWDKAPDFDGVSYLTYPYRLLPQNCHYLAPVELEKGEIPESMTISLEAGASVRVKVKGLHGEQVTGAYVSGRRPFGGWGGTSVNDFSVDGYDPRIGRRLMVFDPASQAVAAMLMQEEYPEGIELQLVPAGSVKGRLVNSAGEPIRDVVIHNSSVNYRSRDDLQSDLAMFPDRIDGKPLLTDQDGRFSISGLMPGMKYAATAAYRSAPTNRRIGEVFVDTRVASGEVKDLGDITIAREDQ